MRLWPRKQVYLDDLPRTHDFRFAVLFVVLFVAVIGAVYAVGYFVAGDRLASGTTVAGVDVGGMRRDEARTTLQEELAPRLEQPIKVTALGKTYEVDPQTAGITVDLEASVDEALGSSQWDPEHMLEVVTGGEAHDAVMALDESEFQAVADRLAVKVELPAVDATVSFVGGPSFEAGVDGVRIDRLAFAQALKAAVLEERSAIVLPVEAIEPTVTSTQASDFVDQVAKPAVAGDVRIRVADTVLVVKPSVFAPSLRATAESGELTLSADAGTLAARSRQLIATLPHHPVNARFEFRNGRPVVVPSRSGASVAPDDWTTAVVTAASKRGENRRAVAVVTEVPPGLSTRAARQLRISQRVGVSDVRVPGAVDDVAVQRAVQQVNAALIRPQLSLSFQQRTHGLPTDAASVVATALFEASFRTGLAVVDRRQPGVHTVGVAGLDATVAEGADLVVRNEMPYGILVRGTVIDGPRGPRAVRIELWGSPYWDVQVDPGARYDVVVPDVQRQRGAGCRPQQGVPGFAIDVSRTMSADGVGARTETVHSRYGAADRVVCRG